MRNFFKTVLANIVAILLLAFVFTVCLAVMFFISLAGSKSTPSVKSNSVLTLDQNVRIIDSPTEDMDSFFEGKDRTQNLMVYDVVEAINKAKTDSNIKGISLEADVFDAGITQIDNIRAALEDFKKSGKFVYAYGNVVSQKSYLLSSVANRVFLNPTGSIELNGMSAEISFFKDFLDKYGIGVDVVRHGTFKAAVEPFMRNDISAENKEQMSTLLNDIWGSTSSKISQSRDLPSEQLKIVADSLYAIIPELSQKYKITDQLVQHSAYEAILKKKMNVKDNDDLKRISFEKYIAAQKKSSVGGKKIAVLYASGDINNGENYQGIYAENFKEHIQKLANDDEVKAVVLRVNSPGGSAGAADEILYELSQLKAKKPLVVSFGDYAASGGYYISMAADKIYSEPNCITGSIGVFGVLPNFKDLAKRNGIRSDIVATNASAPIYSPLSGLSVGGRSILTKSVEQTYKRFVYFVTKNRSKSFEQIDKIAGGRVWSGSRAKSLGLVDELGTLQDAIRFAAREAKLSGFDVQAYPKKKSQWELLMEDMNREEISTKVIKSKLSSSEFQLYEMFTKPEAKGQILMEMPFKISY